MKFTLLALVVVVALLVALYEVDAVAKRRKAKPRRRVRPPPPKPGCTCDKGSPFDKEPSVNYTWEVVVDAANNLTTTVNASVKTTIAVASLSSGEKDSNFTKALIIYDYTKNPPIQVVVPLEKYHPCFVVPTTLLTFSQVSDKIIAYNVSISPRQVKEKIAAYNGTDVEGLPGMALDGTGTPWSVRGVAGFAVTNLGARRACAGRSIIRAFKTPVKPAKARNAIKINILGLDTKYTITLMQPRAPAPPKKPRAGKKVVRGKGKRKPQRG